MTAAEPLMLADDIRDGWAWRRETLTPRDWLVPMPPRCLEELDAAVEEMRRNPLPTLLLGSDYGTAVPLISASPSSSTTMYVPARPSNR